MIKYTGLLILLCFLPSLVFAQSCDPHLAQIAAQKQQKDLIQAAKHAEKIYKGHNDQPEFLQNSDGLLTACMSNNWPKINVSMPALQKILSGAQERATKAACNKARNMIANKTGKYTQMLSTIDGYQNLGVSGAMSQGANYLSSQWPQIGTLKGTAMPSTVSSNVTWNSLGLPGIGSPSSSSVNNTNLPKNMKPVSPSNSPSGLPGISNQ